MTINGGWCKRRKQTTYMHNYRITSREAERAFDIISERGDSITLIDIPAS